MGLKKCLYCHSSISDSAKECPYCKNISPFDENKHEQYNQLENKLRELIICKDCDFSFKRKDLWHPQSSPTYGNYTRCSCPKCGNPNIYIECFVCKEIASGFDNYQNNFACDKHLSGKCSICGEIVLGKEKFYDGTVSGRTYNIYHVSCLNNRNRQQFWKAFPFAIIIQPILIGIFTGVIFGLIGGALCALFLKKYINTKTSSYLIIGFIIVFIYYYVATVIKNIKEIKKSGYKG